jgi:hypothetical protein
MALLTSNNRSGSGVVVVSIAASAVTLVEPRVIGAVD